MSLREDEFAKGKRGDEAISGLTRINNNDIKYRLLF